MMTIEEKAKAYDDALERARQLNANNMLSDEAIEEIFPQLRESEDERIRQALVEFLREAYSRGNAPEECAKWLVWLDQQKEQKPAEWSEEDEDTYNRVYYLFRDAIDEWYKDIFSGCYPKITRDKVLAMLKSLHSRPKASDNWKPSEEQPEGIEGVVHHCATVHYLTTNIEQLNTRLKEFEDGAEVRVFINAKEGKK